MERKNPSLHWAGAGWLLVAIVLALTLGLGACQQGSPFGAGFDPSGQFRDLVGQKRFDEAARVHADNAAWFAEPGHAQRFVPEFRLIANALNATWQPKLEAAKARLDAQIWPAPLAQWPRLRSVMAQADDAIGGYDKVTLLRDPALRLPIATELRNAYNALRERLEADAPAAFDAFELFGETAFFAAYPAILEPKPLLVERQAALMRRLAAARSAELARFAQLYPKEQWPEGMPGAFAGLIERAAAREIGPEGDLAAALRGYMAAKAAGFVPAALPIKFGFIEATSQSLLHSRQIEFPAEVDIDLPVEVVKASLDQALEQPIEETGDFLVVFDVALAKAIRKVRDTETISSRSVIGWERGENPEWQNAYTQIEVARAELNMRTMSGNVVIAGVEFLRNTVAEAADTAPYKRYKEALKTLETTPRYIDVPKYAPYDAKRAKVESRKVMTVNYYVIDRRKGRYFKSTFDVQEARRFVVAYLRDSDPDKLASTDASSDKDVSAWEKMPARVRLSEIIDNYIKAGPSTKALPSLAMLRSEMLGDKNRALAQIKAETFDDRPLNDPRFDSVVAVYRGDGAMGSGFYVRPDVVLTNYHVVSSSTFVEMKRYDGTETFGSVLYKDARLDLALIKVQTRGRPVEFYTGRNLDPGSAVEVIGHPNRHLFSITRGVVSAIRKEDQRYLGIGGQPVLYVQTDAPVNHGNSGGPLFLGNKVVGVNTWTDAGQNATDLHFSIHYAEIAQFIKEGLREDQP